MRLDTKIFHDFFYDPQGAGHAKSATRYAKGHFFSYATEIGMIANFGGGPVLLIADCNFSNTTAAHLNALRNACPFGIIEVPFNYGEDFSYTPVKQTVKNLLERAVKELKCFSEGEFSRKENRDRFSRKLHNLKLLVDYTGFAVTLKDRKAIEKLEAAASETPEMIARRKAAAAKRAAATAKANAERKAAEKRAMEQAGLMTLQDKISYVFCQKQADALLRNITRDALYSEYPGAAFIWIDDDKVKTSKGITIDAGLARRVYRAHHAGKIKPGFHIGPYVAREITEEYAQIGCHKIYFDNINLLFRGM